MNRIIFFSSLVFKSCFILLFLLFDLKIKSQNLISNPGFEKCELCGRFGNQGVEFNYLDGANNPVDWFGVTEGSSDIRSTLPYMGKRHGGFFSFGKFEYLGNVLTMPLEPGAEYQFSFWLEVEEAGSYSLDEIGVFIHKGLPHYSGLKYLGEKLTPNFTTPDGEYLPVNKYKQYSFNYKACGGEDHVIIGRFSNLGKNDTMFIGKGRPSSVYPYTYVDDVELIKIKNAADLLLPDLISLCKDEKIRIGIIPGYQMVKWSNGETGDSIELKSSDTKIYVEAKFDENCPAILDSVIIITKPNILDEVDLIPDTICLSENLKIQISNTNYSTYLWNTGKMDSILEVKDTGSYSVIAYSTCHEVRDKTVVVSDIPINNLFQFPNIFLPSEMENNKFAPIVLKDYLDKISNYKLSIFNRWGSVVFETNDIHQAWNADDKIAVDTYIYSVNCSLQNCNRNQNYNAKGTVTLIR
ncbi:MAG: gliding motility-associated C-terminal domain-containing protein [Saprospiraceae bacterium]